MRVNTITRTVIFSIMGLFFANSIIFSDIGILRYFAMRREIKVQRAKLENVKKKAEKIKQEIANWQQDDFELQKMAREDLQMGYSDEKVFLFL